MRKLRTKKLGNLIFIAVLPLSVSLARPLWAGKREPPRGATGEDFFIVSSLDPNKKQLVLKHPTEVTELVLITGKTVCLDEQGKPFQCRELRAGDTVYVTLGPAADGARSAFRIRKAPMTVEELHRRYLKYSDK